MGDGRFCSDGITYSQGEFQLTEYYRVILDFSHDETSWEEFEKFFDAITDAITAVIDPEHEEYEPCERFWSISGQSVTGEYDKLDKDHEEEQVGHLRNFLDTESVDEFLRRLTSHDDE